MINYTNKYYIEHQFNNYKMFTLKCGTMYRAITRDVMAYLTQLLTRNNGTMHLFTEYTWVRF